MAFGVMHQPRRHSMLPVCRRTSAGRLKSNSPQMSTRQRPLLNNTFTHSHLERSLPLGGECRVYFTSVSGAGLLASRVQDSERVCDQSIRATQREEVLWVGIQRQGVRAEADARAGTAHATKHRVDSVGVCGSRGNAEHLGSALGERKEVTVRDQLEPRTREQASATRILSAAVIDGCTDDDIVPAVSVDVASAGDSPPNWSRQRSPRNVLDPARSLA